MNILTIPQMNAQNSVWFEDHGHDQNYDGDTQSSEEPDQEAGSHYKAVFIPDTPLMASAWGDESEQEQNQGENKPGPSQYPLLVTWLRNLSVMNYLDQVSESLLAEHILVV